MSLANPSGHAIAGASPRLVVTGGEDAEGAFAAWERWRVRVEAGTAWKMLLVATGRADAFCTRETRSVWDVCAPEVICAEAGCRVSNAAGDAIRYDGEAPAVEGIVVARPPLHDRVLERVAGDA